MRWLLRLLWLLLLAAGLLLAFAYPWAMERPGGEAILSSRVFSPETGFNPFTTAIPEGQASVRVLVHMTIDGRFQPSKDVAVLTLTASAGGRTVIASPLTFTGMPLVQDSPQAVEATYRELAGVIDPVAAEPYTFTVTRGEADEIDIRSIDVILEAGGSAFDPRAQPLGYALTVLGFVGLVLSFRRRRENPNSSPPPPKWGRG